MIRESGAKRYAEALFQIGRDRGELEQWLERVELIAVLFGDPAVATAMKSAKLPLTHKLEMVERVLQGIEEPLLNLAKLLVTRGRSHIAPQVVAIFRELVDDHRGVAHAQVTTAVPLSDREKELVAQRLEEMTDRKIILEVAVDETMIGGLVARVGDLLIDGSTRSKLLALKRQLQEARA